MSHRLRTLPWSSASMLEVFSDATVVQLALVFEIGLAYAQADEGVISAAAADAIAAAARALTIDSDVLAGQVAHAGTLAIPLVQRLRAACAPALAADIHKGATSQDLADTVLMRQVKMAGALLVHDLDRITAALGCAARRHSEDPAMGRTLLQDARPITVGLRLAHWARGIADARRRLVAEIAAGARVQLGGAAGTRAGMGGRGRAVTARLAASLDLADAAPWHARRDNVAAIAAAIGITAGMLGKMARDISLLAQDAVGEVREPLVEGRGGSSAMAHKRNPTGSQVALAAAIRAPGIVAGILCGLPAELERGIGGWQAEAPAIAELFLLAGGSAAALADVAEGLEVDVNAAARNLGGAATDDDIGESGAIALALLDRDAATEA